MIDVALQGLSYENTLLIISDQHESIRNKIINDLQRRCISDMKKMIFTVGNRRELAILQDFIHKEDHDDFMTIKLMQMRSMETVLNPSNRKPTEYRKLLNHEILEKADFFQMKFSKNIVFREKMQSKCLSFKKKQ